LDNNRSFHRAFRSVSILLIPLSALMAIALLSITWRHGAFSLQRFNDQALVASHGVVIIVLFIGYYLVIRQIRKTIEALDQRHKKTLDKLEQQTNLLHLETFQHRKTSDQLHDLRVNDPLTQIYNETYFLDLLNIEIDRHKRYSSDFSLLIIELDNFTQINTMFGHECGDFAMRKFSLLIGTKLRKSDMLTRYDGHKLAIIAPNTSSDVAKQLADRLCREIEIANVCFQGAPLNITLSIGIGMPSVVDELTTENIILAANNALDTAIIQGRNQVVNFQTN